MRKAEKYTEMPLDPRGGPIQTFGYDAVESMKPMNGNGRMPGGILKNRGTYDYSDSPQGSLPMTDSVHTPLQSPYVEQTGFVPQPQPGYYGSPVYSPNNGMNVPIYQPTIDNSENSYNTKKTFEKLADVYSDSGDTVQFASNLRSFMDESIPRGVWIMFLIVQLILGFVVMFIGAFNFPFCNIQPKIPLFMIASGILLLINSFIRFIGHFPSNRRRTADHKSKLSQALCFYGIEGIILLAIVINVILGCVWVYGSRYYVHFEESYFDEHFCDWTLYWFAWWTVTAHLIVFGLLILGVLFLLMYGSVNN